MGLRYMDTSDTSCVICTTEHTATLEFVEHHIMGYASSSALVRDVSLSHYIASSFLWRETFCIFNRGFVYLES